MALTLSFQPRRRRLRPQTEYTRWRNNLYKLYQIETRSIPDYSSPSSSNSPPPELPIVLAQTPPPVDEPLAPYSAFHVKRKHSDILDNQKETAKRLKTQEPKTPSNNHPPPIAPPVKLPPPQPQAPGSLKRKRKISISETSTLQKRTKLQYAVLETPQNNTTALPDYLTPTIHSSQLSNSRSPAIATRFPHAEIKTPTREAPATPSAPNQARLLKIVTKAKPTPAARKRSPTSSAERPGKKARVSPTTPIRREGTETHAAFPANIPSDTHNPIQKHPLPPRNDPPDKT
jgi:hypothetical protein